METINQRRTTAAQAGALKPPGARSSVFDNGPMTGSTRSDGTGGKDPRGGPRTRLPMLDVNALTFKASAAPRPPMAGTAGWSKWGPVFDALKADGNAFEGIPLSYRGSLSKVATDWHKRSADLAQSRFIVRPTADGQSLGLYRMAAKDVPPSPRGKKGGA